MKKNKKMVSTRFLDERLAGGMGMKGANQEAEQDLRRSVMSCLLWEDLFYQDGESVVDNIKNLIPLVDPSTVYDIAVEAREVQKLRHVPLLIAREMLKYDSHRYLVDILLPRIIQRVDEITEFVALYWENGKIPLANKAKAGLSAAFHGFNEYQFAKYRADDKQVRLRDVMFLVHPNPRDQNETELFEKIANNTLKTPDTWEVALSTGKNKKETFERLIEEGKLGGLAFLRNLRKMLEVNVSEKIILKGFKSLKTERLLPINFITAYKYAPRFAKQIEKSMLDCLSNLPKLEGKTVFVVDVSGSMAGNISDKSEMTRLDVAKAMAILANHSCEDVVIYATAGNDGLSKHKTEKINPTSGFPLASEIQTMASNLGGGGIFTRQCLDYIREREDEVDRIIIFSDSQDCDRFNKVPKPFAKYNYIVDVSNHNKGINYKGIWTAEISGWSEHFLNYIYEFEKSIEQN